MVVYLTSVTSLSSAEILTRRDVGINHSEGGRPLSRACMPSGPSIAVRSESVFLSFRACFLKKILAWGMPPC